MKLVRYADRPDPRQIRLPVLSLRTFPEYMHHNRGGRNYWHRLYDTYPDFQLALLDGKELVAELHSLPVAWEARLRICRSAGTTSSRADSTAAASRPC